MLFTSVYILYTSRKLNRLRFICQVGMGGVFFPIKLGTTVIVHRDTTVQWTTDILSHKPPLGPFTIVLSRDMIFCGGRKLAN